MKKSFHVEKVKPFRLVKYFTFTSLIVIFLGTVVLSFLNTHWLRSMQLKKSEDYALLIVKNLSHQIFIQFIIPVSLKYKKIQLREEEQFQLMDKVVRSTLHSFHIDGVTIYDSKVNVVSYSYDSDKVGQQDLGGKGYRDALEGISSSKLIQHGNFIQNLFGFPQEIKIVTYAPLRLEKSKPGEMGPTVAVLEIVQDLSEDYHSIFQFQLAVLLSSTTVMTALFLVLLLVVKRGEDIIEKRAEERKKLEAQLANAERLSSIGEMVAGVSHEIRNPLGIIRSSADLLKKKMAMVDPSSQIPDIIVEESTRLNNIITDFLDFARPKEPRRVPCRVEDVLEKNITFLATEFQHHQIRVARNFSNNLPEIQADADMLYQAFLNLLINSMQAMPVGGEVLIDIFKDGRCITVWIRDEGCGIEEEILGKLWDPFFTTKEKGTGLGLGIVKNIIESHEGKIRIENREPRGTRVIIDLPIHV